MPSVPRTGLRQTAAAILLGAATSLAQQTIGTVATQDASVSGALEVTGARAVLTGSSSVTARDHAADVTLSRGGTVRVCQTSGIKFSSGQSAAAQTTAPLMVALDRGAIEIKMQAIASDILLTPDLRFTVSQSGPLDLRVRVTPNGDTCVEQRDPHAPTLLLSDAFSESTYQIHASQHVLFEHGSLREVVDHETSPCGCPEPPKTMSLAEAALRPPQDPKAAAAEQHPFPSAESTGLAPSADIPQAPPGAVHAQVSTALSYTPDAPQPDTTPTQTMTTPKPIPPAAKAPPRGFAHAIGHFFRRIFGGAKNH